MGEAQHSGDEHIQELLLLIDGGLDKTLSQPETGVIDQYLNRSSRVSKSIRNAIHILAIRQVSRQDLNTRNTHGAGCANLIRYLLQALGISGNQD